jgi:hypothetical protein
MAEKECRGQESAKQEQERECKGLTATPNKEHERSCSQLGVKDARGHATLSQ